MNLGFVPDADANRAHHMLLYTCNQPNEQPGKVTKLEKSSFYNILFLPYIRGNSQPFFVIIVFCIF